MVSLQKTRDVPVHPTANEVTSFIISLIALMPNIDVSYLEKILVGKVKCVVAVRSWMQLEICSTFTALHAACVLNNLELVKFFVEHGMNINAQTRKGLAPLHMLLKQSEIDPDIVDYLINHGADLTLKDMESCTPLYIAVEMSHEPAIMIILQQPCDINALCDYGNKTALMAAAEIGDLEVVKLLLANGADPNIMDQAGSNMAIHYSINCINEEIFKFLLDVTSCECILQCKPSSLAQLIIDRECANCLNVLSKSVYKEELLLKETCYNVFDINICEKYKKSSLIWYLFVSCENPKEMFDIIINAGLSVNSSSEELSPPLTEVVLALNLYMSIDEPEYYIKKLINHGADVNYPQPESPEALLCSLRLKEVTLLLLQHSNFATPDSILNGYMQMDVDAGIFSEVTRLFIKLGMKPSTMIKFGMKPPTINKLYTLPFPLENIPNYNTQNICTLKQLCRISLRHFFYAKYKNLSIKEILNNLHLPDCINKYLRYEIL